jgi:hypothetical protein
MCSGNRLVTVPPQALGISPGGQGPATVDSTANVGGSVVVAPPPSPLSAPAVPVPPLAISSRTMEQLAEFDSILESKFQYNNSSSSSNSSLLIQSSNSGSGANSNITIIKTEQVEPAAPPVVALLASPDNRSLRYGQIRYA